MKICFFSKYPPIEGGVSSRTYWLAKALGKAGHEVHIVTNALEVEEEYREKLDFENPEDLEKYQPDNVYVHSLNYGVPKHIPYSPEYLARLINLGVQVVRDYNCDVIDSYYFLPYGLAGMFTKMLTGKPLIVRHAGSDITRLLSDSNFRQIFLELFRNADLIITNEKLKKEVFGYYGIEKNKIAVGNFFGVDEKEFNPEIELCDLKKEFGIEVPKETPILTYIGKYGERKGVDELLKALSGVEDDFFLLLVSGGKNRDILEKKIASFPSLQKKYCISGFVPPWKIPGIIKKSDLIVQLENSFPIKIHMPIQPLEAFSVGTPVLLSEEIFGKYEKNLKLVDRQNVFVADPKNIAQLQKTLEFIIQNKKLREEVGKNSLKVVGRNNFKTVLENNTKIYETANSKEFRLSLAYQEVSRTFWNFFGGIFKGKLFSKRKK